MIVQKKRIRSLERHLPDSLRGQELRFGVVCNQLDEKLRRAGFHSEPVPGEFLLPAVVGVVTRFNAEGKHKPLRHLPMETAYREMEWSHNEYHRREQHTVISTVEIPYRRYPRQFIPPPGVELGALRDASGRLLITTAPLIYDEDHQVNLLHALNVCLELFGFCEVFTPELSTILPPSTRHINWEIFPPGRYPWERLQTILQPIVANAKPGHRGPIMARLKTVSDYKPEFVATGNAGFHGYIVFGFPQIPLYVLESAYYGNATYLFDKNWETLSRLTKAEILDANLQKDRIVHLSGWNAHLSLHFPYTRKVE